LTTQHAASVATVSPECWSREHGDTHTSLLC